MRMYHKMFVLDTSEQNYWTCNLPHNFCYRDKITKVLLRTKLPSRIEECTITLFNRWNTQNLKTKKHLRGEEDAASAAIYVQHSQLGPTGQQWRNVDCKLLHQTHYSLFDVLLLSFYRFCWFSLWTFPLPAKNTSCNEEHFWEVSKQLPLLCHVFGVTQDHYVHQVCIPDNHYAIFNIHPQSIPSYLGQSKYL